MIYRVRVETVTGDESDDVLADRVTVDVDDEFGDGFTTAVSLVVGRKFDLDMDRVVDMATAAIRNSQGALLTSMGV